MTKDSTIATQVQKLEEAATEQEWTDLCDGAKRDGQYPPWWYAEVIVSGLAERKSHELGNPLRVTTFGPPRPPQGGAAD